MNKRSGFSLIELVLSLGLFSLLLTIFLKLNTLEQRKTQTVLEEQNLMAYAEVLNWTLKHTDGPKEGIWLGFQDPKTRERKFVRGVRKKSVCCAEVTNTKEGYRITLRGGNLQKIKPISFFIMENS